jgi:hypothetical protein
MTIGDSRASHVLRLSVAGGLAAAVVYTVAPLAVWTVAIGAVVFAMGRRGLSVSDRRVLTLLFTLAIALRLLFIVGIFLRNLPQHHDMWLGELTGDGAYGLSRGLRARDLLLGVPTNKFDSFVVNDIYGRNYYVGLLTGLQVLFGPIPYSVRVLNGLFFLAGALLLFRLTRRVYGRLPAFAALTVVLFLPSFFVWSASLLKEPLYFLWTAVFLVTASRSLRDGPARNRLLAAVCALAALVVMEGVRHKTLAIGLLGWAVAASMLIVLSRPRRYLPVAAIAVAAVVALLARPTIQQRALDALAEGAKIHAGHVFTFGHGYRLLDEGFYYRVQDPNSSTLTLTPDQAARYVVRAGVSFLLTPLPWQAASIRELVYVPEQLVWYALLALLPFGIVAGWRRDAAATAMFIGYLIPTSAILALTNGNVGTLVRLRGMVMVILVWVSALGLCAVLERLLARASRAYAGWRTLDPETAS